MSTVINWCINKCEKEGFEESAQIAREELVKLQKKAAAWDVIEKHGLTVPAKEPKNN